MLKTTRNLNLGRIFTNYIINGVGLNKISDLGNTEIECVFDYLATQIIKSK